MQLKRTAGQELAAEWREIDPELVPITRFEQSLQVLKNAFEQWVKRCGSRAGLNNLSSLEIQVLHIVGRAKEARRVVDISFVLNVEDTHNVNYAVKKLLKAGLLRGLRSGKDVAFVITEEGGARMDAYAEIKRQFLLEASTKFSSQEIPLEDLAGKLQMLSALYEQAARKAETHF